MKRYLFLKNKIFLKWNIKQLPPNLRNYLYIWCFKLFWRNYIPLTTKVPSWYAPHLRQQQLLFNARLQNIHFMHLSCNTLEKNKKYILGCQCSYCRDYGTKVGGVSNLLKRIIRVKHMEDYVSDSTYFNKCVPYTDSQWNYLDEYINDSEGYYIIKGMSIFDPSYDIFINIQDIIQGEPIVFSEIDYSLFS